MNLESQTTPNASPNAKQSQYFSHLRSQGKSSPQRSLPDLSPTQSAYQQRYRQLLRTPTGENTSPHRKPPLNQSPSAPLVFDSSFSTLDSPFQSPSASPFNLNRRLGEQTGPGIVPMADSNIPDLSPLKRLRSLDPNLQRSTTLNSEISTFSELNIHSPIIFESQNEYEPSTSPVFNDIFNQTISESSSPTRRSPKRATKLNIPLEMQIIINSRPKENTHSMDEFNNLGYVEFWNLSPEEGKTFKEWNKLEFEKQNTIFEVFLHLRKIKFNLNRLVNVYGTQFKLNGKQINFLQSDYDKTFGILMEFYNFLNKLITTKLKPLYDNNFIVSDIEVMKLLRNWFKLLKSKYSYISGSIMYLTQLTSSPERKKWINEISNLDPDFQNRSAVSPNELFNSYFIKLFTSVQLLFGRLKSIYDEMNDLYLSNYAEQVESLIKEINNISDSTSDLEKKISFNEKLSYKTDIHYSYMEMIDMFNPKRITKDPISVEMKTKLSWVDSKLVLFDNFLVPLKIKPNPLNLKDKEGFILSSRPIPLQYIHLEYIDDGSHKILKVLDNGSGTIYQFRKQNDFTSTILDKFVKLIKEMINNLWKRLNKVYTFKLVNERTFISRNSFPIQQHVDPIPYEFDPISKLSKFNSFRDHDEDGEGTFNISASPLSIEYFNRRDFSGHYQRYCILGTTNGLYLGLVNSPKSWKLLYNLNNVKSMTINDESLFALAGTSVYEIPIEKIYNDYYEQSIDQVRPSKDQHLNNVNGFSIGFQADSLGTGSTFLFTWEDRLVNYLDISAMGSIWKQFKTNNKIINLQPVYANNFGIGHVIDEEANWCISNLNEFRFKPLTSFDVKDILKNETPVKVFKSPNKKLDISETLVVYSKFAARFKSSMGKYKLSSPHIIWFGTQCYDASFNIDDKVLFISGKDSCEIYQLDEDTSKKGSLIGCFIGYDMKLLNSQSGKVTLTFKNPHDLKDFICDTIVKVRKRRSVH